MLMEDAMTTMEDPVSSSGEESMSSDEEPNKRKAADELSDNPSDLTNSPRVKDATVGVIAGGIRKRKKKKKKSSIYNGRSHSNDSQC